MSETTPDPTPDEAPDRRTRLLAELRRLERAARPLDPGASRRRRLRTAAVASSERLLRRTDSLRAYIETEGKGAGLLAAPIGPRGLPLDQVFALLEREVVTPGANPAAPGHLAYIPGGGLYHAALGDFLAAVANKYAGVFFAGPGAVRMENMLVRWVADLVGLPAAAAGTILSGGSLATLAAVCAARDAHGLTGQATGQAVVYLTSQAHHCVVKALRIAGLADAVLRFVPTDARHRMRPDALADTIGADRAVGLRPWLVTAAAGTVDTGTVDPLDAIGAVAARERCWFHVDAAYGGFFLLTEHGRRMLAGIERADSVVLDPHKGLFLPYGSGIVVVRDAATLLAAHHYEGAYMQDALSEPTELSPAELSPELSRHFRGLRMWLPLILLGTAPFQAALDEKLLLARYFRQEAAALGFEVGPEPDLSIVTFRRVPAGATPAQVDALNRAIVEGVRRDGRVFLSSTMVDGRFTIRLAVLAFRTHRGTVDLALRVLREQAAAAEARLT
jgi:aromatic-L-amino-acid decarboxylase